MSAFPSRIGKPIKSAPLYAGKEPVGKKRSAKRLSYSDEDKRAPTYSSVGGSMQFVGNPFETDLEIRLNNPLGFTKKRKPEVVDDVDAGKMTGDRRLNLSSPNANQAKKPPSAGAALSKLLLEKKKKPPTTIGSKK
jgi:hypothetical protein